MNDSKIQADEADSDSSRDSPFERGNNYFLLVKIYFHKSTPKKKIVDFQCKKSRIGVGKS